MVLMNQMTTKITQSAQGRRTHLVPALGESWGHASTIRVIMCHEAGQRRALLYKSPSMAEVTISYDVTSGGIRDVEYPEAELAGSDSAKELVPPPPPAEGETPDTTVVGAGSLTSSKRSADESERDSRRFRRDDRSSPKITR